MSPTLSTGNRDQRGSSRSYAFVSLASHHFTPQGKITITSSLTRKIDPGNFQGQDVVDFSPWVVLPDEDKVAFLISCRVTAKIRKSGLPQLFKTNTSRDIG
uniref:Uncharacterized mitochondrial protein AtMg01240 n=1 Tax=Arabidopsis thaliana TaxID=3702 RepID=M1240_ARATH|nr:RecName: Full=Uncharacterized mitochondrial protein AtMg01240; AltName: Full=ORF100c [Arabidopsis thaliana]CAA69807.1 unnamed protein product [Arabidopsis thaliana]